MSNVFFRTPDVYDKYRPVPPQYLLEQLLAMNGTGRPNLIVDLGCSTGNSTRVWAAHADRVIGVEPSSELCAYAKTQCANSNVEFNEGYGHDTHLPSGCADIVSAASSIHWMDPISTIPEIHRILKPDGLFTHFGPVKPPVTPFLELDAAFLGFFAKVKAMELVSSGIDEVTRHKWDGLPESPLMRDRFPLSRLFFMHQYLQWGAEEYKGWVKSLGVMDKLIKVENKEFRELMDGFFERVDHYLAPGKRDIFFVYKVFVFKRDR